MRCDVGKVKLQGDVVELRINQAAEAPEWVLLLRKGRSTTVDGVVYRVDDVAMNAMIQSFESKGLDMVIDYEHQSLTGDRAPAAGWIKELEARDDGLWGRVEWTPAGREYIANREYRYMSPVFWVETDTDRPVLLDSVALTNRPRIKDYPPIVNKRGAGMDFLKRLIGIFKLADGASEEDVVQHANKLLEVNSTLGKALAKLAALVGLDEKAEPDKVVEGVTMEVNRAKAAGGDKVLIPNSVLGLLGLPDTAGESEVTGAIQGLKAGSGQHADLVKEINALKKEAAQRKARDLVEGGVAAGKITPDQKAWALKYAETDPKGFEAYLNTAPQVVPVDGLAHGPAGQGGGAPDAIQQRVNSLLGISAEDIEKYGPKQAGEGA
jgi:phage I-like protein